MKMLKQKEEKYSLKIHPYRMSTSKYHKYFELWQKYYMNRKKYFIHFNLTYSTKLFNENILLLLSDQMKKNRLVINTKHNYDGAYIGIGFRLRKGIFTRESYALSVLAIVLSEGLSSGNFFVS